MGAAALEGELSDEDDGEIDGDVPDGETPDQEPENEEKVEVNWEVFENEIGEVDLNDLEVEFSDEA